MGGNKRRGVPHIVYHIVSDHESDSESEEVDLKEIYAFMKTMKKDQTAELNECMKEIKATLGSHNVAIRKLEELKNSASKDLTLIKNNMNEKEQRDRNYSVRIFNLSVPSKPNLSSPSSPT